MDKENALVVFQGKNIRKRWFNDEWWFVISDVVAVLTESVNPSDYLKKLRKRDDSLSEAFKGEGQLVPPLGLEFDTAGGRQMLQCWNTIGILRLLQSIPSPKAEPFKLWLAQVGYERIKEIENPELAQDRVKEYYELKGYPKEWIDKRLRGIAIRQELTEEWKQRGIEEQRDFAILTNEISTATFGKTVQEYKQFKGLQKPNQNLRDHMGDWELILTMVGEKATTDITVAKDAQGFPQLQQVAKEGGDIAKNTRTELEQKIGKSIISNENYLYLAEGKKKKIKDYKED